jgi:hypothetical protein
MDNKNLTTSQSDNGALESSTIQSLAGEKFYDLPNLESVTSFSQLKAIDQNNPCLNMANQFSTSEAESVASFIQLKAIDQNSESFRQPFLPNHPKRSFEAAHHQQDQMDGKEAKRSCVVLPFSAGERTENGDNTYLINNATTDSTTPQANSRQQLPSIHVLGGTSTSKTSASQQLDQSANKHFPKTLVVMHPELGGGSKVPGDLMIQNGLPFAVATKGQSKVMSVTNVSAPYMALPKKIRCCPLENKTPTTSSVR